MGLLAQIGYQNSWIEVLGATFMRHAFIGGTLVALASGLVGYFVVVRRDAFAAHALAHIGFPGATGAALIGAPVTLGLAVFCVAGGLAIGAFGKRVDRREVATGTVLAFATSLGVLFASMATDSTTSVTSVLFGNLLAISAEQLIVFGTMTAVLVVAMVIIARPLLFASITPEVAEARGVPVRSLGIAFLVLLALVVAMATQVVGTLLLFALVVTPAATALVITARPIAAVAIATGIALGCVWGGLVLSAMFNLPPSFPIVSLAFGGWLAALARSRVLERSGRPTASASTLGR
ncbi:MULTISPECIES: metal ABC transporter permease [Candidatus Microthrix]|jgi:zinc/manganese transport system permease protein|uniref:ABC-3 protein n=1 Tax=Candidatus Neomicrothrix parvicella RN1 TaxID=1229780 RepID=R4YZA7_9ACTN|nr:MULTISPECIES: metal ABC transporter permease [Microthrix]HBX10581.1 metal ABC transporter permease [Candidatus Microthrix parvicella]MBK6503913.1 metal ABC transporter permease [Candidatus Microthrix sp.]MBK7019378.1 metal ABC transporter permease [Candidatus Microthrix sp.]MBK7323974.1 metal ABC transporter permease [Candidatus Microthrix sp.]MBL0204348.1 metal ABC transporter permease [Candidatus Microthrix sp.]